MTPGSQMHAVLTRHRDDPLESRLMFWVFCLIWASITMGVGQAWYGVEESLHLRLAEANAPTYEDGLALANKRLKKELPKSAREEVEAMVEIAWRESRFDPKAQNPNSTSHGLFGFLGSTCGRYGGCGGDPMSQTRMALRYVADRYGSPKKALAFHRKNGWF